MKAGLLTQPRKSASQQRSRATVDALIEATARILVRDGYEKTSTNRIADEAGVSIGSLYQYYPGKEALVAAVVDRHNDELMNLVRRAVAEVETQPVELAVRALVAVAVEAHRIDPRLHRVLAEQIPRTGRLDDVEAFNREAHALFRGYLERHKAEIAVGDLDLAAFITVSAIEAVTHNAVLHGPNPFLSEAVEILIDEATRMIVGYLQ